MQHLFDSHAHIFPGKIAEKAAKNIGAFYDLHMDFDGSVDKLLEVCAEAGVEKCLVHSVATTHEQVPKINNFIFINHKIRKTLIVRKQKNSTNGKYKLFT